jgi:putative tryptophan/tyrosine transport system substrate-binding protein
MKIEFISFVLSSVLLVLSVPGEAEQAREPRVAVIGAPEEPRFSEIIAGFKKGLAELGYAPPSLVVQEIKVARAEEKTAESMVQGLLQQRTRVLFLIGSRFLKPVREASAEMPVVFIIPGDPVSAGFVESLSHPGRNTTAMTFEYPELSDKRLEFVKELAPRVRRVLSVYDPRDASPRQGIMAAREAAPNLGLTLIGREARGPEELRRGLEAIENADAYLSIPGGFTTGYYDEITRLANAKRLPTMFHAPTESTVHALATYGASDVRIAQEAARLVDKILKGAKCRRAPCRASNQAGPRDQFKDCEADWPDDSAQRAGESGQGDPVKHEPSRFRAEASSSSEDSASARI